MSRAGTPPGGLDALRAAVVEARGEQAARSARTALVSGRERVEHRVGAGSRLGRRAAVPSPAAPGDDVAATGERAVSLALVHRAQAGDADAFALLYDRYVDVVHRYLSYRLADRQLVEDLTSETFLRALRRISTFSWQGSDVGAWFVTIARNLVLDHVKSSRYRLELTTDDLERAGAALPAVEGPEAQVLVSLRDDALLDAVRRLSTDQQECVVLRFLQGLTVAETALVMGRNEGAVKALQHRAVRALGRLLPEQERP